MNIGSVHVPTLLAAVLVIIGVFCVFKFVVKKFV